MTGHPLSEKHANRRTDYAMVGHDPLDLANAADYPAFLDQMTLVAPSDGVVARLDISSGERVAAGTPVISFADFSEWYVETTDLSENEVVNIKVAEQTVSLPDAIPGLELAGQVESIAQTYTEDAGDIVYKTRIRLSDVSEALLRWGMTVEVRFNQESQ